MTAWISLGLALAAFTALSLAMDRHQEQVLGRALARPATLRWRVLGWALLVVSLLPCLALGSTSLAITVWAGTLSFAALALGLLLSYAPRAVPRVALAALSAAVLAWLATHLLLRS